jgi:hypothetical protein
MPDEPEPLSVEQLLSIARSYWRFDKEYHYRIDSSPEHVRLCARWDEALKKHEQWLDILEELERELPGFSVGDGTATPDACFRCIAYPGTRPLPAVNWLVVGCVSILAPLYIVYGVRYGQVRDRKRLDPQLFFEPLPPEMRAPADVISRKLEETYGYSKLPAELARTPVPLFVQWVEPPETTLFHALFTNEPDNVP